MKKKIIIGFYLMLAVFLTRQVTAKNTIRLRNSKNTSLDSVNYNLVCVDSVWYEPGNKKLINVRIFNGDVNNLNYPSVQIVSPLNDTIGNPDNFVTFFAQLGTTYQVYTDTITDSTITSFSSYTFLISELFGDTTVVINWCASTGIDEMNFSSILVSPNPADNFIKVEHPYNSHSLVINIYNLMGGKILSKTINNRAEEKIDVSYMTPGFYIVFVSDGINFKKGKFLKQ